MKRALLVAALCSVLLTLHAPPAGADCSGPTIVVDRRKVVAGGELTLTGVGWGDNCYDTGPPPSGEGVLGVPIGAIEIAIHQGTEQWLVATGSADAEYGFTVTVDVPSPLRPGRAEVLALWDGRSAYNQDPFVSVVDGPAPETGANTVATFGTPPSSTQATSAPASTDPGRSEQGAGSDNVLLIGVIAAAVVAGVLIARRISLAQKQPPHEGSREESRRIRTCLNAGHR